MSGKLSYDKLKQRSRYWRKGLAGDYKKPGGYTDEFKSEVLFPEKLQRRRKHSRYEDAPVRVNYSGRPTALQYFMGLYGINGSWGLRHGVMSFRSDLGAVLSWIPRTGELRLYGDLEDAAAIWEHFREEAGLSPWRGREN